MDANFALRTCSTGTRPGDFFVSDDVMMILVSHGCNMPWMSALYISDSVFGLPVCSSDAEYGQ